MRIPHSSRVFLAYTGREHALPQLVPCRLGRITEIVWGIARCKRRGHHVSKLCREEDRGITYRSRHDDTRFGDFISATGAMAKLPLRSKDIRVADI